MLRALLPAAPRAAPSRAPRAALAAVPFWGLAAALLLAACDTAPGADTGARNAAPTVSALTLAPSAVFRDDLTVTGGRVRIPISASAAVMDPEGRLDSVLLIVENPVPTATGGARRAASLPSPSCPSRLRPQHTTVPLVSSAHE